MKPRVTASGLAGVSEQHPVRHQRGFGLCSEGRTLAQLRASDKPSWSTPVPRLRHSGLVLFF